jgi:hypothetical protein
LCKLRYSFLIEILNQKTNLYPMKKALLGLSFLAFMATTTLAQETAYKDKNAKCEKTQAGCCKKGEKATKCCADMEKTTKSEAKTEKKVEKKAATTVKKAA